MGTYLEDHPPASKQYVKPRRAKVTAIVVHTAESSTDLVLPDGGAEGVASFISRRSDPGSYHTVVDSDSRVRVVPYGWEAFHDGTGGNRWSLGLSFACRAAQWPTLPHDWYVGALRNGAIEAAAMARWVRSTYGTTIPADRITPAEYRRGVPGFVGHGKLDPERRSDPGLEFPWEEFLANYADEMAGARPAPAPIVTPALVRILTTTLFPEIAMPLPTDVKLTWSLHDLTDCTAIVDELYRIFSNTDADGQAYWHKQLARILEQGRDPRPLLAEIAKQLREAAG